MRKTFAIIATAVAAALATAVAAGAAIVHPNAPYCIAGANTSVPFAQQGALNDAIKHTGGVAEFNGVWYTPDFDNDPGDTSDDVTVYAGNCITAPTPQLNNAYVGYGTAPFGGCKVETVQAAQQLLDGTYVGQDGVYRTCYQQADGTLTPNLPTGMHALGTAIGGAGEVVPLALVLDPNAQTPGSLIAGWNIAVGS